MKRRGVIGIALGFLVAITLSITVRGDEFSVAAGYYQSEQWQQAVRAFERVLAAQPPHPQRIEAEFYLAESLVQIEDYARAAGYFERFAQTHSQHALAARALYRSAECYYFAEQTIPAARGFRDFVRAYPDDPLNEYALPYLAFLQLAAADPESAEATLNDAVARYPDGARAEECRYQLAELEARNQHFDASLQQLDAIQKRRPAVASDPKWMYWQGNALAGLGKRAEAVPWFERVVNSLHGGEFASRALLEMAEMQRAGGNAEAATHYYQQLLAMDGGGPRAEIGLLRMGQMQIDSKDYGHAIATLSSAVARFPQGRYRPAMLRALAEAYAGQDDHGHAIELLEELIHDTSDERMEMDATERAAVSYRLGQSLLSVGRSKEARDTFSRIRTDELSDEVVARIEYARAAASEAVDDLPAAQVHLATALAHSQSTSFGDRIRWKQIALFAQRQQVEAAFDVWQAWRPDAQGLWFYREAMRQLGSQLEGASQWRQAHDVYSAAAGQLAGDDERAECLLGIGRCALAARDWKSAALALSQFAESFSQHAAAPASLLAAARAYGEMADETVALAAYQSFLTRYPDHPERWRASLEAAKYLQKADSTAAIRLLVAALKLPCPADAQTRLLYRLAWILDANDRTRDAAHCYRQLQALGDASRYWADVTYRLARYAYDDGDYQTALAEVEHLLAHSVDANDIRVRPYALYLKARIAMEQANWQSALSVLDELSAERVPVSLAVIVRLAAFECCFRSHDFQAGRERLDTLEASGMPITTEQKRWCDVRLAQMLADEGDWTHALQAATTLLAEEPVALQRADSYLVVARCEWALRHVDKAFQALAEASRSVEQQDSPLAAEIQWTVGELHYHQKNYDQARDAYLEVRPEQSAIWYGVALIRAAACCEALNDPERAAEIYRRLAKTAPGTPYRDEAMARLERLRNGGQQTQEPQLPVSLQGTAPAETPPGLPQPSLPAPSRTEP